MWIQENDIYLISEKTLKEKSLISNNVDSSYIIPAIKAAQDIHLAQVIGRKLVEKLCEYTYYYQMYQEEIPGAYRLLLNQYVQDYLMFQVRAEIEIPLWGKARSEGVVNANGTEYQNISRNDVTYIVENYRKLANALIEPMRLYLDEHHAEIPEWQPCHNRTNFSQHICL